MMLFISRYYRCRFQILSNVKYCVISTAPEVGIEQYGHRAVINQLDLHIRSKASTLYRHSKPLQLLNHSPYQRFGDLGSGGSGKAGTPPPPEVGIESKLRDHQRSASYIAEREIDLAALVGKDTQTSDLVCQQLSLGDGVLRSDSKQNYQSGGRRNLADHLTLYQDSGGGGTLEDCPHPLRT
jgi:hypothetical protein